MWQPTVSTPVTKLGDFYFSASESDNDDNDFSFITKSIEEKIEDMDKVISESIPIMVHNSRKPGVIFRFRQLKMKKKPLKDGKCVRVLKYINVVIWTEFSKMMKICLHVAFCL